MDKKLTYPENNSPPLTKFMATPRFIASTSQYTAPIDYNGWMASIASVVFARWVCYHGFIAFVFFVIVMHCEYSEIKLIKTPKDKIKTYCNHF